MSEKNTFNLVCFSTRICIAPRLKDVNISPLRKDFCLQNYIPFNSVQGYIFYKNILVQNNKKKKQCKKDQMTIQKLCEQIIRSIFLELIQYYDFAKK